MKIKFTLQRQAGPVDLIATVDAATTVGALAEHLLAADPLGSSTVSTAGTHTLAVAGGASMDAGQLLVESPLRSGAAVSIAAASERFTDSAKAAAAVVHVLEGPDAGREFTIASGASVIGRERGVDVRLSDPLASRRHARLNVTDAVEIIDLGSANGTLLGDDPVPRSILRADDVVQIGDTKLSVRMLQSAPAGAVESSTIPFVRSPRLDPTYDGALLEAPEPPERQRSQRFPVVPMLAPLLMGALLYLITKSLTSLIFVGLSPIMLLGNAVESRLAGRSAYKAALKEFRDDLASLVDEATAAAGAERAGRDAEHPSVDACVGAVRELSPLLWTRRPGERGFAELRFGLGTLPSRNRIEQHNAQRGARAVRRELAAALAPFAQTGDVPVTAALADSAIGLAGPRTAMLPVARAVVAQLVALHSPAELVLGAIASSRTAGDWDWIKWLPHTSSAHSPIGDRHLASSPASATALVSELEELIEQRGDAEALPAVVVIVEGDAPVEHSRLVGIASTGARRGVHVIWLGRELGALPAACGVYVDLGRDGTSGTVGFLSGARAVTPVRLETLDETAAHELARRLAPVLDAGARVDDASDLPRSASLLTINGPELAASPDAVLERWSENRSIITGPCAPPTPPKHAGTLRAVIGQSASEMHALDLRSDGPHALVGGTTGAGKSELLQSWILAMAAAHSPQRLTFLLVDYKGGSAFRDCVQLPHTVGLVTDLSPHLVRRALTSLAAELRYREHVLAQHNAKDLIELEKKGVPDAPPSLVIVVDEFAALVTEVPEFVDGVVNVAQRGRSLGLHLILATQRPAGVIKDNLRANTNLRLALRMADEADSADVLGSPEAAFFDPALPGRAVSKTGPGRLVPFQTGYVGGWTSDDPPPPDIHVEELSFGTGRIWALPEPEEAVAVDLGPTDIQRLVASVRQANGLAEIPAPRKPWLPELKTVYDLSDKKAVHSSRTDTELAFAVRDDPDNQTQPTVAFQPDRDGNLAVYGTGGSGKSTLLRTLAIAAGFTVGGGPCHVYGIDFGARGLAMLEELPHVGSIIAGSDHERIVRLLGWLRGLIDERALRYSRANAGTISEYRLKADAPDEARILLLVDGIAAFRQNYETPDRQRFFDLFVSLATDGRPVGVHVVLSSDQRSGMTTALASAVQRRVVLRLATADEYAMLGVPGDILTPASPPGRGILGDEEIQVALLGTKAEVGAQAEAIKAFAQAMRRSSGSVAPPIRKLPEQVRLQDLPPAVQDLPVLGLAGDTLAPVPFDPSGGFIISGPSGSGRSTALRTVALAIRRWRPSTRFVLFTARRSPLSQDPIWNATAVGVSEVSAAAASLSAELPDRLRSSGSVAVFVENLSELSGGLADGALAELLKLCNAEGMPFVVDGETSSMSGGIGLIGQIKAGRAGIALQPETSDGSAVYRTNFPPRTNRAEFPPGRGLLVRLGRTRLVQVAVDGGPDVGGGG